MRKRSLADAAMLTSLLVLGAVPRDSAAAKLPRLPRMTVSITQPAEGSQVGSPVSFEATVINGVPPFTYRWTFSKATPRTILNTTPESINAAVVPHAMGKFTVRVRVIDGAGKRATARVKVMVIELPPVLSGVSINSTSVSAATPPATPVAPPPLAGLPTYNILPVNDLGMHCGDLDHRIASILPPFNVVHVQVIRRGEFPAILTQADADVFYAAASSPLDPALVRPAGASVVKTNFWDANPRPTGNTLGFDAYNPFYPPGILALFPMVGDMGLPVPDLARLYLGDGQLVADQQNMPGISAPYSANDWQQVARFYSDMPFFTSFPFGYQLTAMNWFAAEGIPITPTDDAGRWNPYPLFRFQARAAEGNALGQPAGTPLATADTVLPVASEVECFACHTSPSDGAGDGDAAGIPGLDPGVTVEGSPRTNTPFTVALASQDTSNASPAEKLEWAADWNILRLHDAKNGTNLAASTPVVCQRCHYTPALDLAHLGPMGPADAAANGREQRVHGTNSRVIHTFHGQMTDLFPNDMPDPLNGRRSVKGKPVINAFVLDKLNVTCYRCHPGRTTKCLRGRMFQGGLICQDCHGEMLNVGNDFSANMTAATPFPEGIDLTRRIPWADEPACQSCHTGDALDNLGLTDSNVIQAADGVRLLQAYRTNDLNARPIVATNRRFAESVIDGKQVLFRLSKGHGGVYCEGCHGSTHAEWPVPPDSGPVVANDNVTAQQIQQRTGTIRRCTACHPANMAPTMDGPHGLHPIENLRWTGGHGAFAKRLGFESCETCHGVQGQGTPLSAGVQCYRCHSNPITRPW